MNRTFESSPSAMHDVPEKISVLHVVSGLYRAGIETYLMHVLRRMDRARFRMDFLVHAADKCAYDDEATALGSRVIPCPHVHNPVRYAKDFFAAVKAHGPYDVIHIHGGHFGGYIALLARLADIPKRIVHGHHDVRYVRNGRSPIRRSYEASMDVLINRFANVGLAASELAAEATFGPRWQADPRRRVLFCGLDFNELHRHFSRSEVRAELGIPENALVIGTVGRITRQKNPLFMLQIVAEAIRSDSRVMGVFVGEGDLEASVKELAADPGVSDKVMVLGSRSDVPRLLLACFDLFLFPSLGEGLGLALIEAQAAGLPCVISDVIPDEADVVESLITRLPLDASAREWAAAALKVAQGERSVTQSEALSRIEQSPFNIEHALSALMDVYADRGKCRGA